MKKGFIILMICAASQLKAQLFNEVSTSIGLIHYAQNNHYFGGGVGFADFDNDGWDDIYISGGSLEDKIFLNNQGVFEALNSAALSNNANFISNSVAIGDIDNDGDKDIFIPTGSFDSASHNLLYLNNGDATFTDISQSSTIVQDTSWSMVATFGDYNLDGWLDLYVGNYVDSINFIEDQSGVVIDFAHVGYENRLYINNGDLTFTESSIVYGVNNRGSALGLASTDYDMDFDIDIHLANDFGSGTTGNAIFNNQWPTAAFDTLPGGNGADLGIFAMGVAVGDYDEDLDLDYYITNLGSNSLLSNNFDHTFTDLALPSGTINSHVDNLFATSWGTVFFDADNDSYLDLFVANGHIPAANVIENAVLDPNKLFMNNGDGSFTDSSVSAQVDNTARSRGVAVSDFDNDGDLDFAVGDIFRLQDLNNNMSFYKNETNQGNWFKIDLEGVINNRDAYGAKVYLEAGGRTFLMESDGGSSHGSKHSDILHFGLDTISQIDRVSVMWPGGMMQRSGPYVANQQIHILEDVNLYPMTDPHIVIQKDGIILQLSPVNDEIIISNYTKSHDVMIKDDNGQILYESSLGGIHKIPLDQSAAQPFSVTVIHKQTAAQYFKNIFSL